MKIRAKTKKDLLGEVNDKLLVDDRTKFRCNCLSSDLSEKEILDLFAEGGFEITRQGDFYEMYDSYRKYEKKIDVYLYLYVSEEVGSPIIYTLNSSSDYNRTAEPIIESSEGIYYYWIPPKIIESIKEEVLDKEGSTLNFFAYKKLSSKKRFEEERRPSFHREGTHESEDAAETLEEWKVEYGITPTKLRFNIPRKVKFSFSNLGEFVLESGDARYFHNKIVSSSLQKVMKLNKTVQSSNLSLEKEDGLERVIENSLEIKVENPLEYNDKDEFLEEMKNSEFHPSDVVAEKGSLLLDSRIVDEKTGGIFSLSTDGESFSLLPKYDSGFDCLMRFYQFMVEHIDSDASVLVEQDV